MKKIFIGFSLLACSFAYSQIDVSRATEIKNETTAGSNTALRVGGLFEDIVIKVNSIGLEKISEGDNTGLRKVGAIPENYGNIGSDATDLSFSPSASTTNGATGIRSVAMGTSTRASDSDTFAAGLNTQATNDWAMAFGVNTHANGRASLAAGNNVFANAFGQVALGVNGNSVSGSPTVFVLTDQLFTISNGSSSGNRSDAFVMLKSGLLTLPSLTATMIKDAPSNSVVTKAYTDLGGITANRPSSPSLYQDYFDSTLGYKVTWNGSDWVDGTGAIR